MKISVASREAVIADREPGQDVGRQMIDEDQPQRHARETDRAATRARRPTGSVIAGAASRRRARSPSRASAAATGGPAIGSAMDVIWHRFGSRLYAHGTARTIISARSLQARYADSSTGPEPRTGAL